MVTQLLDIDTPSDVVPDSLLEVLGSSKPVNKPDISSLPDAFSGGLPLFHEGDKIVVERYAAFLKGKPYLDTKTFRVERIDIATGRMHLFDEGTEQNAIMNWHSSVTAGNVFKLARGKVDITTKRKRGRPKKASSSVEAEAKPAGEKRGRGRPKGVKNRDKEIIAAEKIEKAARRTKRAAAKKRRTSKKGR